MRHSILGAAIALVTAGAARAQAPQLSVLRARHVLATAQFKIFNPAGAVTLVGWDRDSVAVRGRPAAGKTFYFYVHDEGGKIGLDERAGPGTRDAGCGMRDAGCGKGPRSSSGLRSDLIIYLPRRAQVSVKTVDGDITTRDASGWFYTVAGNVRMSGAASSVDVQSMSGSIDLDVTTPWVRARSGDGNLLVRGQPQDVDASTIAGTLSVASASILRGQLASVSGDIHYAGAPAPGGILDFSNHSGAVELLLPRDVSGSFALSSIVGTIDNGLSSVRPVAATPRSVRFTLGRGGASITVRTFKGAIRLKAE